MYKIVNEIASEITPISINKVFDLNPNGTFRPGISLFAYHCKNSEGYCFLSRIKTREGYYGFIALNMTDSDPRYMGSSIRECIEKVLRANRQIFMFATMEEMIKAIYENRF